MNYLHEPASKEEILGLQQKLNSSYPKERKEAVKKVISLMRFGENVKFLFSDMLRSVKTDDFELKKLVYLYLVNYSTQEPEQAIMAVNTFIQDSEDGNPLIRALAVRNMCLIKLESIAENMIFPLKQRLKDSDDYVRKTAVFGAVKLYECIPASVENSGILDDLLSLLNDVNPMVVANTTAALFEINGIKGSPVFELTKDTISSVLNALVSSTEWCQVILLDSLSKYVPVSHDDAAFLIDRLVPLLKNSNPSVVVGAFRCIYLFIKYDKRKHSELFNQIIPPFITLVAASEYEIQYVVLKTLNLFIQKYPRSLTREIRVFFCKYNDPSYIKMEKLDIIVTICSIQNVQLVLDELDEYCKSVDIAFVKKSVRCIGQIAMKIEVASVRCVDILVNLVSGKAEYALEESIIVVSDILRRFPGQFESVIATVCANISNIKDAQAKASAIWILGEYCRIIVDVDTLLDPFIDSFHDEQPEVQLQILTAFVKLFIEKPDGPRDQIQCILNEATKPHTNPDVRNRAYIYWRLLSADGDISSTVIRFDKNTASDSSVKFTDAVLEELLCNTGTVSGVLHVVPSDFVRRKKFEKDNLNEDFSGERKWTPLQLYKDDNIIDVFVDFEPNTLFLKITNKTSSNLSDFALALNKNIIGMTVAGTPMLPQTVSPLETFECLVPIMFSNDMRGSYDKLACDIAIRTSVGTVFGGFYIPAIVSTMPDGRTDQVAFRSMWTSLNHSGEINIENITLPSDDVLADRNVFLVGRRENKSYFSLNLQSSVKFVLIVTEETNNVLVSYKCSDERYDVYFRSIIHQLLSVHY